MDSASVLLHPVRLRIVQAMLADGALTTRALHDRLDDVPIATLYRHVGQLAGHGLLEVAEEQRVGGASERTYRLAAGFANPTADDLGALDGEQLLAAFTVFASGLIRDFADYVAPSGIDLAADRVSFAQAAFWASDDEVDALGTALMAALEGVLGNDAAPHRRRRVLSTVLLPRDGADGTDAP